MRLAKTWLLCALSFAAACSDCKSDDHGGEYEVLAEGDGEQNAEPLQRPNSRIPLHRAFQGESRSARDALWQAPASIGGVDVHRVVVAGDLPLSRVGDAGTAAWEAWVVLDDEGTWLMGGTQDGLLPGGVLQVPRTLRKGMKWRSRPTKDFEWYTFEVFDRRVEETPLGEETVVWIIQQLDANDEPIAFRSYVEGWGQAMVSDFTGTPPSFTASWQVVLEPAPSSDSVEQIPSITLRPADAIHKIELEPGERPPLLIAQRVDYINAFGSDDGGTTTLSFIGPASWQGTGAAPGQAAGGAWEISGRAASYQHGSGGGSFRYDEPFRGWPNVHFDDDNRYAYGRYDRLNAAGTSIQTSNGIYTASGDFVMFEYPDGAISGVYGVEARHACPDTIVHACGVGLFGPPDDLFAFREPFAYDGSLFYARRALQGPQNDDVIRWAVDGLGTGHAHDLWGVQAQIFPEFVLTRPARFVAPTAQGVSTFSTADGHTYYLASPGGVVTSVAFGVDGRVTRETVGRVGLEPNQPLVAAVHMGNNAYVFVTRDEEAGEDLVWGGVAPQAPKAAPPETSVAVEAVGHDVRICWPWTEDELESDGWLLGGVPSLGAVEISEGCALVTRDLGTWTADVRNPEPGYFVVEGPVPGIGRVRALVPNSTVGDVTRRVFQTAWRSDGGFIRHQGLGNGLLTNDLGSTAAGGILSGNPPYTTFGQSNLELFPDQAGHGMWVMGVADNTLRPMDSGLALTGPEPLFLPLIFGQGHIDGHLSVEGGGVLVSAFVLQASEHDGLAIVRPDGSILELEHPEDGTPIVVRANDEVCGMRVKPGNGGSWLYCSAPDGTVREQQLLPGPSGDVHVEAVLQSPVPFSPIFEGRVALVTRREGADVGMALFDLDGLELIDYQLDQFGGSVGVSDGALGADGVFYATVNPDGEIAALTADGATAVSDRIRDLRGSPDGISRVVVDRLFAYGIDGEKVLLRIPRRAWEGDDTACVPTTEGGLDADGDGAIAASSCGDDCDDSDMAVHPGATEVCDGIDNDCDGRVDEGGSTCWQDADGDGFAPVGAPSMMACACEDGWTDLEPTGANIDCADTSADAFPGQVAFFETGIEGGTSAGLYFDYDCDGAETRELPRGACEIQDNVCTGVDGFISGGDICGTYGDFLGCVAPGNCSMGMCVDSGALICTTTGAMLRVQQRCR